MKSKFLLLFCSLFIGQLAFSQVSRSEQKKYVKKYEHLLEEESKLIYIDYYQSIEKVKGKYIHKTYNPDKVILTHLKTSSDKLGKNLNGIYAEWYDNRKKWLEGNYIDNKKEGAWKSYNYSNTQMSLGNYNNGKKEGEWKSYDYSNFRVTSGNYVNGKKDGKWITKNASNQVVIEKNYKNGFLNGQLTHYDTTGQKMFVLTYLEGSVTNREILDTAFYFDKSLELIELPILKICSELEGKAKEDCRNSEYIKAIYTNIKYPTIAREEGVEGTAIISFIVEKDGSIGEFKTHRGISKEIEIECLRVLQKLPEFSPATKNGESIKFSFNMPIRFRLE